MSCRTCSPPGRSRHPTSRSRCSTTRPGPTPPRRRRPGAPPTPCRRVGVEMGITSRCGCRPGPDVLRAWFGANAAGAVYSPLNLAARGSYLQHTLNLAGSKVLVAQPDLVDRLAGLDLPHLEQVVLVGDPVAVDLPWPTRALRRAPRRRLGRAPGAPAAGRALGRPQPDLHVRHDRPVEGRQGLARRLLELWQLLHRAVRRRERPLPAAAADVLHGGHRDHLLDAPGRRLARVREGLQLDHVLGRRPPLRRDDHDRDPRDGLVHARPARARRRRRQSAARRLHGPADASRRVRASASAAASTPRTG